MIRYWSFETVNFDCPVTLIKSCNTEGTKASPREGSVFHPLSCSRSCEGLVWVLAATVLECLVWHGQSVLRRQVKVSSLGSSTGESILTGTQGFTEVCWVPSTVSEGMKKHKRWCFISREFSLFQGGSSEKENDRMSYTVTILGQRRLSKPHTK